MKRTIFAILSALALGAFVLNGPAHAQFGQAPLEAKEVSAEDAAKNYPPPKGGYPTGELTASMGVVKSPYPPHRQFKTHVYDKSGKEMMIKRGAFILDPFAKKVFVNP